MRQGKASIRLVDLPGNSVQLDIYEIPNRLPHRYPFLLVDRVLKLEKGKRIAPRVDRATDHMGLGQPKPVT